MPSRDREIRPIIIGSIRFIQKNIASLYYLPAYLIFIQTDLFSINQDEEKKCVCKNILPGFACTSLLFVLLTDNCSFITFIVW
jgi:hypothetical protein